jgi:hypothetical protein
MGAIHVALKGEGSPSDRLHYLLLATSDRLHYLLLAIRKFGPRYAYLMVVAFFERKFISIGYPVGGNAENAVWA